MKLMKRVTALLLSFLMLNSLPVGVLAQNSVSGGDLLGEKSAQIEAEEVCEECSGSGVHTDTCFFNKINIYTDGANGITLDFLPAGLVAESESMTETTAVITANPVTLYKSLDNGAEGIEVPVESGTVIDLITKYTFTISNTEKLVFYRYDYYGTNEELNDAALSEYSGYVFIYAGDISIKGTDDSGDSGSTDILVETEKTDSATGVVVSAELPEDVTLTVTQKTLEESGLDTVTYPVNGASLFYDVTLYQNSVEYQPENGVTVTFPEAAVTDSGLAIGDFYKVYHIHDGVTDMTGPYEYTGGSITVDFANLSVVGISESAAGVDLTTLYGAFVSEENYYAWATITSDAVNVYGAVNSDSTDTYSLIGVNGVDIEVIKKATYENVVLYQIAYRGDDAEIQNIFSNVNNYFIPETYLTFTCICNCGYCTGTSDCTCCDNCTCAEETPAFTTLKKTVNDVNITVEGVMPADVTLYAEAVTGYDGEFAADIKLMQGNEQWQPSSINEVVALTLDAAAMGLSEGQVVTLTHIHNGVTVEYTYVVVDGKIIFYTDNFSVYVVNAVNNTYGTQATGTANNPYQMTVGDTLIFYCNQGSQNEKRGEWQVIDAENSIIYTVHNDGSYSSYQRYAPWITVTAVDASETNVVLSYKYDNDYDNNNLGTEIFYIRVNSPSEFYVDDRVAETGCLVPAGGTLTGVIEYTWSRSDGQTIQSTALNENGTVNISLDRGGVTNSREPITYTVVATDGEGKTETAEYTVYYGNEILNPSFETPTISSNYTNIYVYNGYPGVYWKTTSPGSTDSQVTQDIELIRESNSNNSGSGSDYGVASTEAGSQFAEVNAENFGALYQDMLTTPGSTFTWSFSHAGRHHTTSYTSENTMFVVVAATEDAQAIQTEAQIDDFLDSFDSHSATIGYTGTGYKVTYDGGDYYVWRHEGQVGVWENISGTYTVPEGQYLTRLFFVSDTNGTKDTGSRYGDLNKTCGNLIDAVSAGETMTYKVEYYLGGTGDTQVDKTVPGNGSVYTTVTLPDISTYIAQGYVLTAAKLQLATGDVDYPGNVANGLYITSYGDSGDADYAIVLKVYLAQRAVTIKKNIVIDGWADMTDEEKTALIGDGLTAEFALTSDSKTYTAELTIIAVSSTGDLTAMGEFVDSSGDAPVNGSYTVSETSAPAINGYSCSTRFDTTTITISETNPTGAIVCTNTYEQSAGTLVIEKTVTLAYEKDTLPNDTFIFTVSGDTLANGTYNVTVDGVSTPVQAYNGELTVSLSGFTPDQKKTITINGIPAGVYTVTEISDEDYLTIAPNGNIIVAAGGTGTASFTNEYKRHQVDLTIKKTGWDITDEYQSFIFDVTGPSGFKITVTTNGNEEVTIKDLPIGEYTVTERTDWSWRYDMESITVTTDKSPETVESGIKFGLTSAGETVEFKNKRSRNDWLSGDYYIENQFEIKSKDEQN